MILSAHHGLQVARAPKDTFCVVTLSESAAPLIIVKNSEETKILVLFDAIVLLRTLLPAPAAFLGVHHMYEGKCSRSISSRQQ